jgi:hypothetical protein
MAKYQYVVVGVAKLVADKVGRIGCTEITEDG